MHYIVNVSGGASSFEALRRTIAKFGKDFTHAIFADTRIEDPTLYQFLDDQERYFGIPIHRVQDGRTPFDIWRDEKLIIHGYNGYAPCSELLKRIPIKKWIDARFDSGTYTLVIGMEWSEVDRMQRVQAFHDPIPVWFPLADKPYLEKCDMLADIERLGMTVPSLYLDGFGHNNCGGGCVKAGHAHWAHLYKTRPDTYAQWEREEQAFRAYVEKDVSILRDRRNNQTIPLTLAEFRTQLDDGRTYDSLAWGGCGCFAPVQQSSILMMMLNEE